MDFSCVGIKSTKYGSDSVILPGRLLMHSTIVDMQ